MQRITGKEITERKTIVIDLLRTAIGHHNKCQNARRLVSDTQRLALWHGWNCGRRLNEIKPLIPTGDWLDWLEANFCTRVKCTIRTAQIYMKIDADNATLRSKLDTKRVSHALPDPELITELKFDTVRKYAIGFVPDKSQPEHKGNKKFPRLASVLNIANEFARLKQRHIDGLQKIDMTEAREELADLYAWLSFLFGNSVIDPLASSTRLP